MGYLSSQKSYILYDIHNHSFFVSRHVNFQKDIFPFKHLKATSNPIFSVFEFILPSDISPTVNPAFDAPATDNTGVSSPNANVVDNTLSFVVAPSVSSSLPSISPSRRSNRHSRPLLWLQDFVTHPKGNTFSCPMSNQLYYSHLSSAYRKVLQAYSVQCKPVLFKEAVAGPAWVKAIQLEIAALKNNNTWSIIDFPPSEKAIGYR